jgi:hypothetical protein
MNIGTKLASVIVMGALLSVAPGLTRAAGLPTAEEVEKATTPAQHEALAQQYADEAADLRKKAAMHESMLKAYENASQYQKTRAVHGTGKGMVRHCKDLVAEYTKAAADAEAMAAEHRALAAAAKK